MIELDAVGDEIDEIQGEIAVLSNANCPQLISYVGSYAVGTQLWIAMEYLSGAPSGSSSRATGSSLPRTRRRAVAAATAAAVAAVLASIPFG